MENKNDHSSATRDSRTSREALMMMMRDNGNHDHPLRDGDDENEDDPSLLFLSSQDIEQWRGRFEQLEYQIMTSNTSTSASLSLSASSSSVWKDFRRVYTELDILQEEIMQRQPSSCTRVNARDLVRLLEQSRCEQLRQLWNNSEAIRVPPQQEQQQQQYEDEDEDEDNEGSHHTTTSRREIAVENDVEQVTLRNNNEATIPPRGIMERNVSVSSWVERAFVPQQQQQQEQRGARPTTVPHYNNSSISIINDIVNDNLLLADLSGHTSNETMSEEDNKEDQRRQVLLLLDQCEATKFPFKKKLRLDRMGLVSTDSFSKYLIHTPLGKALHKLSLAGNPLGTVPTALVQNLPTLRHLDLSECELRELPHAWHLPWLKKLNLSHNRLRHFPNECVFKGLPELVDLNLYGNKITTIVVPTDATLLTKLEVLNVGYNDLVYLPPDLDRLVSLKSLKAMNNFIEQVPRRVCDALKMIDVTFNPVIQPPLETCERGICSMRRYFYALQMEEEATHRNTERFYGRLRRSI